MRAKNLVPIFALALAGCSQQATEQAPAPPAEVDRQQALKAISDIRTISLHALYETVAGGNLSDGRLTFSMDDEANLATGSGRFEIKLEHYALPTDSPLAGDYHGYVLTGIVEIDSRGYAGTFGAIEVTLRHPDPRRYPVRRIEAVVLEQSPVAARAQGAAVGGSADRDGVAGVRLFVNGRRMPGRLLLDHPD
jgi:hypothetical protein